MPIFLHKLAMLDRNTLRSTLRYAFKGETVRSIWLISALMLMMFGLSACTPTLQPRPVSGELAKTQEFLGLFEITPPQGSDWYEIQRAKGVLTYGKKLEVPNHTFIASVHVYDTDRKFGSESEFLMFIKNARAKDTNPDRFNILRHDEILDKTKAPFCTRFQMKAEDGAASKTTGFLSILEARGFSCLHPRAPKIVTIEYSERSASPMKNEALIAEGERFISSLEIR